jgi:hypothetical protein
MSQAPGHYIGPDPIVPLPELCIAVMDPETMLRKWADEEEALCDRSPGPISLMSGPEKVQDHRLHDWVGTQLIRWQYRSGFDGLNVQRILRGCVDSIRTGGGRDVELRVTDEMCCERSVRAALRAFGNDRGDLVREVYDSACAWLKTHAEEAGWI